MILNVRSIRVLQLIHQGKSMQEIADDPTIDLSKSWVQIECRALEDAGYVHNPFRKYRYRKGQKRTLTAKGKAVLRQEGVLKEEANGSEP